VVGNVKNAINVIVMNIIVNSKGIKNIIVN